MLTLSVIFLLAWIVKVYLEMPIVNFLKTKYYRKAVAVNQPNLVDTQPNLTEKDPDLIDQKITVLIPNKVNTISNQV
jgi:hypothetical protein